MNVAIIGAGVAGLSCAHELERYGIAATIYERNSYIGEQVNHVGAILEIMDRPIKDVLAFVKSEFDIEILPLNKVKTIITYTPNKSIKATGKFGYFIKRSKDIDDIKNQLFSKLKMTKIIFNEIADYETLKKQYDFVVIATGGCSEPKELGCFNELFNGFTRGATVLGEFDPHTILAWINKEYCKHGYGYLTPFDEKKAFIGLIVSDVNEIEVEQYWQQFLNTENVKYAIVEEFKQAHISGFVYPHKVENILFAGNTGGALSHFLGFGMYNSIYMGSMAGRAIATGQDYEKLIQNYTIKNKQKYQLRRVLEMLSNKDLDNIATLFKFPPLKYFVYNSKIDVIKYFAKTFKFFTGKFHKR